MNLDELITKVSLLLDPFCPNEARIEAFKKTEEYKTELFKWEDLRILCSPYQTSTTIIFGLRCFEYKIKHSWSKCDVNAKKEIKDILFDVLSFYQSLVKNMNEAAVICSILSQICVFLIKCEWPQQWPTMLDELFKLGTIDILQAKVIVAIFQRLVEDVIDFKELPMERKKTITSAVRENLCPIINYLIKILESYKTSNKSKELVSLAKDSLLLISELFHYFSVELILNSDSFRVILQTLEFLNDLNVRTDALECFYILLYHNSDLCQFNITESKLRDKSKPHILKDFFFNSKENFFNNLLVPFQQELHSCKYSIEKKTLLVKYSGIFARLCILLVEQKSLLNVQPLRCTCSDIMNFNPSCLNWTSHLLLAMTAVSLFPIQQVFVASIEFWTVLLKQNDKELIDYFSNLVPKFYANWKRNMYKHSYTSEDQKIWSESDAENDNLALKWYNHRFSVQRKGLEVLAVLYPEKMMENVINHIKEIISLDNIDFQPHDFIKPGYPYLSENNAILNELECVHNLFPGVLNAVFSLQDKLTLNDTNSKSFTLKNGSSEAKFSSEVSFNSRAIVFSKCEHELASCLNQAIMFTKKNASGMLQDPRIRQYILTCLISMLEYCGQQYDKEFLIPLLEEIFISLTHKAEAFPSKQTLNIELDTKDPLVAKLIERGKKPRCILDLQVKAASSLLNFVKNYPSRVLNYYDPLSVEITKFWSDDQVGILPKCILLEVMINLCLRKNEDSNTKLMTLKNIFNSVLNNWFDSSAQPYFGDISTSAELIHRFGLHLSVKIDKSNLGDHMKCMEFRTKFNQSVETLLAVARQLDISDKEQKNSIASVLMEPFLLPLIKVIKCLNEIHDPVNDSNIHQSLKAIFEVSKYTKCMIMGISPCESSDSDDEHEDNSPFHCRGLDPVNIPRLRGYLSNIHEKILLIFAHVLSCLSNKFYELPLDHIQAILQTGCLASFNHLPLHRLNFVLRKCLQVFVQNCPAHKINDVLIPVLPPLIDACLEYTDSIWKTIEDVSGNKTDHDYLSDEVFKEHLVRILGRTVMGFIRFSYEQYDPINNDQTSNNNLDYDDENSKDNTSTKNPVSQKGGDLYSPFLEQWSRQKDSNNQVLFYKVLSESLGKALAWSDGQTTHKVMNSIKQTLNCMDKISTSNDANFRVGETSRMPVVYSKNLISNILVALQTNCHMSEVHFFTSIASILLQIYNLTSKTESEVHLRPLILSSVYTVLPDQTQRDAILERLLSFENQVYNKPNETNRIRVEVLKKVISCLVGTPLCEQFKEKINIPILPKVFKETSAQNNTNSLKSIPINDLTCISDLFGN